MELTNEIKSAFEAIAPELLPDCDVKYIPAECEPKAFRKRIKECSVGELIIFTNCVLQEKNEFLGGIAREHNDTNMMAIGAAVTGPMLAMEIVDTWLGTEFSGEARHQRRIDKIMALEK